MKILSSMATREFLQAAAARFQAERQQPVAVESIGGVEAAKRVQSGYDCDLVVLAESVIAKLCSEIHLVAGSQLALVKSGIAAAITQGKTRPAWVTEADVRQAVLGAAALAYSTGPSGVYLEQLFARWGILEQLRARIVVPPPGTPVARFVAEGRCALGFQQYSEMLNQPGIDLLGPLPDAVQLYTTFSGAVSGRSTLPAAAADLLRFLTDPAMAALKQQCGLRPG